MSPPTPQSPSKTITMPRITLERNKADHRTIDQTIPCNGTTYYAAQPSDFYTDSAVLCGFASCLTPDPSSLENCCLTPVQSNGLYRYCEPRKNDTNWQTLGNDWLQCVQQSPASGDPDGSFGIGCNRLPSGASLLAGPSVGGLWTVAGLLALMLCLK